MNSYVSPRFLATCAALAFTTACHAQLTGNYNFEAKDLEISGGETSLTNFAACVYIGKLSIAGTNGVITGSITRREFTSESGNSTPKTLTIDAGKSKVSGGLAYHGETKTVITNDPSGISMSVTTTTQTLYGADFFITATNRSLTNFVVKGRAVHRVVQEVTKSEGMPSYTNKYRIVELGGASFSSGQTTRGVFNAN